MTSEALVDLLKWLLIGCAAGYPFLGGFIVFLVRQLVKAKDENTKIMQKATIWNEKAMVRDDRLNCVLDKVVQLLK